MRSKEREIECIAHTEGVNDGRNRENGCGSGLRQLQGLGSRVNRCRTSLFAALPKGERSVFQEQVALQKTPRNIVSNSHCKYVCLVRDFFGLQVVPPKSR